MNDVTTILLHAVFAVNLAGLLALTIWLVARKETVSVGPKAARRFITISALILLLKLCYVLVFTQAFPERILSTDGTRYLYEMRQIAEAPWKWNPITGVGPHYDKSPKMGMSYLYGVILFMHGVDSLYAVLLLNLAFAYLMCLMVYLLTRQLSDAPLPAAMAMLLAAVYPETSYWTARVVRENLTLFLVPALVYLAIRLRTSFRLRDVAAFVGTSVLLVLTRAQLGVILLLTAGYFLASLIWERLRPRTLILTLLMSLAGLGLLSFVKDQIREAVGQKMTRFLTLDLSFWVERLETFFQTAPKLFSFVARGDHGLAGLLLAPAFLAVVLLYLLSILNARRIYPGRSFAAGLMIWVTLGFLFGLACAGLFSIRFRVTIIPLVIPLVAVTAYYYWNLFQFPRLVIRSTKRP